MKCKFLVALGVLTTLCLPLFGGNDTDENFVYELKDLEERSEKKDKTTSITDRKNETTPLTKNVKKNKKKKRSTIYTILKAGFYIFLITGGTIDLSNVIYNVRDPSLTSLPWNATLPESTSNCTYSYHEGYHDKDPMCEKNSLGETQAAPEENNDCYILEKCGGVSYEQPQFSLSISSLVLRGITFCGTLLYDTVQLSLNE